MSLLAKLKSVTIHGNLYIRALQFARPYWKLGIYAAICTAVAAGGMIYLPWVIKDIVDDVLQQ